MRLINTLLDRGPEVGSDRFLPKPLARVRRPLSWTGVIWEHCTVWPRTRRWWTSAMSLTSSLRLPGHCLGRRHSGIGRAKVPPLMGRRLDVKECECGTSGSRFEEYCSLTRYQFRCTNPLVIQMHGWVV